MLTNTLGVASAPAFTANTVAGNYTVLATVAGFITSFSLKTYRDAGQRHHHRRLTSDHERQHGIRQAALQATVDDQYGNPISGVSVTFTAPKTGSSGKFAGSGTTTATTNAQGVAHGSDLHRQYGVGQLHRDGDSGRRVGILLFTQHAGSGVEHHGHGGDAAERGDRHGVRHRAAGDGRRSIREPDQRRERHLHGTDQRCRRQLRGERHHDGDDQLGRRHGSGVHRQ